MRFGLAAGATLLFLTACRDDGATSSDGPLGRGGASELSVAQIRSLEHILEIESSKHRRVIACAWRGNRKLAEFVPLAGAEGELLGPWLPGENGVIPGMTEVNFATLHDDTKEPVPEPGLVSRDGDDYLCFFTG